MCCSDPYKAISVKHTACIKSLITRDYILNCDKSYTLLNTAACHPDICAVVFDAVETVLSKDELKRYANTRCGSYTALLEAAGDLNGEYAVRRLIEFGADVMFINEMNITALIRASCNCRVETVQIILNAIRDHPNAKNYINQITSTLIKKNALQFAMWKGNVTPDAEVKYKSSIISEMITKTLALI